MPSVKTIPTTCQVIAARDPLKDFTVKIKTKYVGDFLQLLSVHNIFLVTFRLFQLSHNTADMT